MMSEIAPQTGLTVQKLRNSWLSLVLLTLWGLIIGIGLAYVIPPQWEVTALLDGGHTGDIKSGSLFSSKAEDGALLLKRLRSAETMMAVMQKAGYAVDKWHFRKLSSSTFFMPVGSYVEMRIRADSYEAAEKIANGFLEEVKRQEQQVINMDQKLREDSWSANARQKIRLLDTAESALSDGKNGNDLVAKMIIASAALAQLRDDMEMSRLSIARFVTPVSGFPWPVFPDPILFALIGTLIGLAAGLVRIFVKKD